MSTNIIKHSPSYFEGINKLTKYIIKEKLTREELQKFLEVYSLDKTIIKRIFSYISGNPQILIYINKYLNNLYENYDLIDFIFSIRYILRINNISKSTNLMFVKSLLHKYDKQLKIIQLLSDFFSKVYNLQLNYDELLIFFNLYSFEIITDDDIVDVDLLLNDNKQTINIKSDRLQPIEVQAYIDAAQNKTITAKESIAVQNEKPIDNIINKTELQTVKLENCKDCKLFSNQSVIFDTNVDINISNNMDVAFITFAPNLEDAKRGKIFADDNIVRKNIAAFPTNITWGIFSLLSCAIKNKSNIGNDNDVLVVQNACNQIFHKSISKYTIRYFVLIGDDVCNYFSITGKMSEIGGKIINNNMIPVIHPSNMRNPVAQRRAKESWDEIQKIVRTPPATEIVVPERVQPIETALEIKPNKKNKTELFLLDIRELDHGTVLLIYTDVFGNKHYEKKPNKYLGYIKETGYQDCNIITDAVDAEFIMTKNEKWKLTKKLNEKINTLKIKQH